MAEIKGIKRIKARILAEANEYAAAKDAEAEARRAYLSAHSAAASGEGRALDALSEELARKKTALDKAGRDAALPSKNRSGLPH